jgi:hypothetical protein
MRKQLARYAGTSIHHIDAYPVRSGVWPAAHGNADRYVLWRMLHRIRDDVLDALPDARRICGDHAWRGRVDPHRMVLRRETRGRLAHERDDLDRLHVDLEHPLVEAGDVEDVRDECLQSADAIHREVEVARVVVSCLGRGTPAHDVQPYLHRSENVAQVVRQDGDELLGRRAAPLGDGALCQLLDQLGAVRHEGDPMRHRLREADVVGV